MTTPRIPISVCFALTALFGLLPALAGQAKQLPSDLNSSQTDPGPPLNHQSNDQSDKFLVELELAARQGHALAQFSLGSIYAQGALVPQDMQTALHWYEQAAGQNVAAAQYNLGVMYEYGQGVARDYSKAQFWFEKALALGDVDAWHRLHSKTETQDQPGCTWTANQSDRSTKIMPAGQLVPIEKSTRKNYAYALPWELNMLSSQGPDEPALLMLSWTNRRVRSGSAPLPR